MNSEDQPFFKLLLQDYWTNKTIISNVHKVVKQRWCCQQISTMMCKQDFPSCMICLIDRWSRTLWQLSRAWSRRKIILASHKEHADDKHASILLIASPSLSSSSMSNCIINNSKKAKLSVKTIAILTWIWPKICFLILDFSWHFCGDSKYFRYFIFKVAWLVD